MVIDDIYDKILSTFPAIEDIQDAELRENVVNAWTSVLKESSYKRLEDIPFSVNFPEVSLVQHITWVLEAALCLASLAEKKMGLSVNKDLLIAAVFLHDLGKAFAYQKEQNTFVKSDIGKKFGHGFWGAHIALKEGVSTDLAHLIATHTHNSPLQPQLLEGVILHYADFAYADILRFQRGMETYCAMKARR